jgi:hypothetical protein
MDRNVGRKGSEPIKAEALRHLAERILKVEDETHGFYRLGSDVREIVRPSRFPRTMPIDETFRPRR